MQVKNAPGNWTCKVTF